MLVFSKDKYLKEIGIAEECLKETQINLIYEINGREINELRNKGYIIKAKWCEEVS